jgi:Tfp pilus assembly PilM family ATPase
LSGGAARMEALKDAIGGRSRAMVEVIDPLRAAGLDGKTLGALDMEQHGPAAAVAFGLALRKDRERNS